MLEIPIQVCAGISVSFPLLFLVSYQNKKYVTGPSWNLVGCMPCHVGEIAVTHLHGFKFSALMVTLLYVRFSL
jgi:hypothetical protein